MQAFKMKHTHVATMKKIILLIGIVLAALAMATVAQAGNGTRKVNLRGTWKFILGDNMKYAQPGHNDADWEKIYVPSSWQEEGFRRYYGYAWYRTRFTIEFNNKEALYLELGRIDDADEVFINGHRVGGMGGFPPDYFTAHNVPRTYAIPSEYLLKGKENVIAVRVYDQGGEGGILGREVGIFSYDVPFDTGVQLMGNWKFKLSDDVRWAREDCNDADWENIVVPATWESQGFPAYDGYAWYRKRFTLPADYRTADLAVLLGKIDDMDEVYINGKRIGGTGDIERRWARDEEWQKPRTYFIPDQLLKPGKENVIAVRVYDQGGNGGIFEGPAVILPVSQYKEFWRKYSSDRYHPLDFSTWFDW